MQAALTPQRDRLNPALDARGRRMIMATRLAGTIATRELGAWVAASVTDRKQQAVQRALDTLYSRA